MSKVAEWLGGNWGWVVLMFSILFEIKPFPIHPISSLLGWIGKKITGGLREDIAKFKEETEANFAAVQARQDTAEKEADLQRVAGIKTLVLDFANSCMNDKRHTLEEFNHVIEENKVYTKIVEKHHIENDVYSESYAYILRVYRKCLDEHKFLTGELKGA